MSPPLDMLLTKRRRDILELHSTEQRREGQVYKRLPQWRMSGLYFDLRILVAHGLLEDVPAEPYSVTRLTDAGRAALNARSDD